MKIKPLTIWDFITLTAITTVIVVPVGLMYAIMVYIRGLPPFIESRIIDDAFDMPPKKANH